jgi:hypothetical protein
MESFEAAVMQASETDLQAWEAELTKRSLECPKLDVGHVVYLFVTDRRVLPVWHLRHRVLARAGHKYAARLAIVDKEQHASFYGMANAVIRELGTRIYLG